jgi:hypothetical protein
MARHRRTSRTSAVQGLRPNLSSGKSWLTFWGGCGHRHDPAVIPSGQPSDLHPNQADVTLGPGLVA